MEIATITKPAGGLRFIETPLAVERKEDWSQCRSRSRAERRRKQGKRQNVIETEKPIAFQSNDTMFVHPDLMREMRRSLSSEIERRSEALFMYGLAK